MESESALSLLGCEFIMVAFRSAKVASVIATFAEQKATMFCITSINSQPIRVTAIADDLGDDGLQLRGMA